MIRRQQLLALLLVLALGAPGFADEPDPRADQMRAMTQAPLVVQADLDDDDLVMTRDVPYTSDGTEGPSLDVYSPRGASGAPAILFLHGGPSPPGGLPSTIPLPKDWQFYKDYGRLAAAHGFVALVPNYRYRSIDKLTTALGDIEAALEWLTENAKEIGADPQQINVWLFSGGGAHLGFLATGVAADIQAIVAFYPVAGLDAFASMGMGATRPEIVGKWEPAGLLDESWPPLFIARAGRDSPAINASIDAFVAESVKSDVTLELLTHPAGQHGFDLLDDVPRSRELIRRAFAFLSDR